MFGSERSHFARVAFGIERQLLITAEAIDDATFLQVIRSHLNLHVIPGENAYAVHSHTSCQMTEYGMIPRLLAEDFDLEHGIWKRLFHYADQLNDILGHRTQYWESRGMLQSNTGCFKNFKRKKESFFRKQSPESKNVA